MIGSYDPSVPSPAVAPPLSFPQIWWIALTQPSVAAYRRVLAQAEGKFAHAYGWVALAALVAQGLVYGVLTLFPSGEGLAAPKPSGFLGIIVLALIGLVVTAGSTQIVAQALGGTGHYKHMLYLYAASQAPIIVLSSVADLIPVLGTIISGCLMFYGAALVMVAVQAANQLEPGKAIVASLAGVGLTACGSFFFLALLGPLAG